VRSIFALEKETQKTQNHNKNTRTRANPQPTRRKQDPASQSAKQNHTLEGKKAEGSKAKELVETHI
jgi:hypothetical protein